MHSMEIAIAMVVFATFKAMSLDDCVSDESIDDGITFGVLGINGTVLLGIDGDMIHLTHELPEYRHYNDTLTQDEIVNLPGLVTGEYYA